MANTNITKIKSRWILDSRGNPTVETDVYCGDIWARAVVPSGASTGEAEALELRDGGKAFLGKGVMKAVQNVNDILAQKLQKFDVLDQEKIDAEMIAIDGSDNKGNLGANAILSVSLASARLAAKLSNKPLYQYIYEIAYKKTTERFLIPIPQSNVLNGGKHAGSNLSIQEFMILPVGAKNFSHAVQMVAETYQFLKKILTEKYGKSSINVGDEGGFAPNLQTTREALDIIIAAIENAGYTPGLDFVLGLDAAASEFHHNGLYNIDGKKLNEPELVEYFLQLVEEYPLKNIEDPFNEESFEAFAELTRKVRDVNIVVDDLTVTNVKRLQKAINIGAGNSLLLKVNQIGTLTEAISAAMLSMKNYYSVVVSHRSGETCDNFISDLAVGLCNGQTKIGAPCRSDRNSKYNQLLRIEEELNMKATFPKTFKDWRNFI
ncbi:MAG: phosphopyruvate hydratase [Candidatus Lokiarchaeota archaeon]|nr:phosphopyruvate hydratase [Candidatus Lokiarchaeota archaeon]